MIIKEFQQAQYDAFCAFLAREGYAEPLDASYTVSLRVNDVEYEMRLQPERYRRVAVLQARRIVRGGYGPHLELITNGGILTSLMELLADQTVRRPLEKLPEPSTNGAGLC